MGAPNEERSWKPDAGNATYDPSMKHDRKSRTSMDLVDLQPISKPRQRGRPHDRSDHSRSSADT